MESTKFAGTKGKGLYAILGDIKQSLNIKVDKVSGKGLVKQEVEDMLCTETTDGTYILKATIYSGKITYKWEKEGS